MKLVLLAFVVFCSVSLVSSQELSRDFIYERSAGEKSGLPIFELTQKPEVSTALLNKQTPFDWVGLVAQPERGVYHLTIFAGRSTRAFKADDTCKAFADGAAVDLTDAKLVSDEAFRKMHLVSMITSTTHQAMTKIAAAKTLGITCGETKFEVAAENFNSLKYAWKQTLAETTTRGKEPK